MPKFINVSAEMNIHGAEKNELVAVPGNWDEMTDEEKTKCADEICNDTISNLVSWGRTVVEAEDEDSTEFEPVEEDSDI